METIIQNIQTCQTVMKRVCINIMVCPEEPEYNICAKSNELNNFG